MANPNLPSIISNINTMNFTDLKLVISAAQKVLPSAMQKEAQARQQQQQNQSVAQVPQSAAAPAPQPAAPAPAAPAPVQASVDTSGPFTAMRRVKENIK